MRGRTSYTTSVPLIPLLVIRYVSGISKSGPRTNTLTYSMTHSATCVELDVLNMAVGCVSTEWMIVLEVTRRAGVQSRAGLRYGLDGGQSRLGGPRHESRRVVDR